MTSHAQQVHSNSVTLEGGRNASGWEQLWQCVLDLFPEIFPSKTVIFSSRQGRTPWDSGEPQPALAELFDRCPNLVRGKALVPGCGTGYDVEALAKQGYQACGIDSSETAIRAARERFAANRNVSFEVADFFTYSTTDLSLIYDYTFLCAMPPEWRTRVSGVFAKLLTPGRYLATLIYPIDGDRQDGPPYSMSIELWRDLVGDDFELVLDFKPSRAAGKFGGSPTKVERQHMALWRRR